LTFSDVAGTTNPVHYQVGRSNKPNLPPATAANVTYKASSNTLTVSGPVAGTPTQPAAPLPAAAPGLLTQVGAAHHRWYLKANLLLQNGAALLLEGTRIGGDVGQLRLHSNNSTAANSVVNLTANYGWIDIDSTQITSWDDAANGGLGGPDTEVSTYKRA